MIFKKSKAAHRIIYSCLLLHNTLIRKMMFLQAYVVVKENARGEQVKAMLF